MIYVLNVFKLHIFKRHALIQSFLLAHLLIVVIPSEFDNFVFEFGQILKASTQSVDYNIMRKLCIVASHIHDINYTLT